MAGGNRSPAAKAGILPGGRNRSPMSREDAGTPGRLVRDYPQPSARQRFHPGLDLVVCVIPRPNLRLASSCSVKHIHTLFVVISNPAAAPNSRSLPPMPSNPARSRTRPGSPRDALSGTVSAHRSPFLLSPGRFMGRCHSSNRPHPEVQTLALLKAANDLEEIARLRIVGWTEHAHQTLGRLRGRPTEFPKPDGRVDMVAQNRLADIHLTGKRALHTFLEQRLAETEGRCVVSCAGVRTEDTRAKAACEDRRISRWGPWSA